MGGMKFAVIEIRIAWAKFQTSKKQEACERRRAMSRVDASRARIALLFGLALLLSSCASLNPGEKPKSVTVVQVLQMSRQGVPAEKIIEKMRESRTVYRLKASELVRLHDQGVPDAVLNYMQRTYLNAVLTLLLAPGMLPPG